MSRPAYLNDLDQAIFVAFCCRAPAPDCALACKGRKAYITAMINFMNIGDRARLRERFYGESLSVLARL